ncbi:hypothetical protein TNCV_3898091 [Trichonephila clavipes]|nr:hypothetical protein TNCV_3898091 [Trichonephila clavipes]
MRSFVGESICKHANRHWTLKNQGSRFLNNAFTSGVVSLRPNLEDQVLFSLLGVPGHAEDYSFPPGHHTGEGRRRPSGQVSDHGRHVTRVQPNTSKTRLSQGSDAR